MKFKFFATFMTIILTSTTHTWAASCWIATKPTSSNYIACLQSHTGYWNCNSSSSCGSSQVTAVTGKPYGFSDANTMSTSEMTSCGVICTPYGFRMFANNDAEAIDCNGTWDLNSSTREAVCQCNVRSCTACNSVSVEQWIAMSGTGTIVFQVKQTRTATCSGNTCTSNGSCSTGSWTNTNNYRCSAGYYGSVSTSNYSCALCPCMTDTGGVNRCGASSAGTTLVSGCVMATEYEFNDGTGDYSFTTACPASL
ncbi:MAG: hypothetical protein LBJ73_04015 [Rickettsiales bacterium]|jgi:hypothetical protein|nr:hypothetical protein [Rickettsiales bacterium]